MSPDASLGLSVAGTRAQQLDRLIQPFRRLARRLAPATSRRGRWRLPTTKSTGTVDETQRLFRVLRRGPRCGFARDHRGSQHSRYLVGASGTMVDFAAVPPE